MKRLTAPAFLSVLVLAACPADSTNTTSTAGSTSDSSGSSGDPSGASESGTTEAPTTVNPTTGTPETTTTDATTGNATATTSTTTTTDPSSTSTTDPSSTTDASTSTTDGTTGGAAVCGDGVIAGDEACDDSNLKTELSTSKNLPLQYEATACIDDCSLTLSLCGNGKLDPGEQCDDGNPDSYDACTTSCTTNTKDFGSPCKRMCNQNCDTDVTSGTFTGCENMADLPNAKKVCYVSTKFNLAPRYFAEGMCAWTAQVCSGGIICPPNIGSYDNLKDCPAGTTLVDRTTMNIVTVKTKVCQPICESDADCRWNAWDAVWAKPGQYRCQTTPDSNGVKICADSQN